MSDYRRYFVAGGTYFFTLVTESRAPLFDSAAARRLLGDTMRECLVRYPVPVIATVLLPDHLHALWTLPDGDVHLSPLGAHRSLRRRVGGGSDHSTITGWWG